MPVVQSKTTTVGIRFMMAGLATDHLLIAGDTRLAPADIDTILTQAELLQNVTIAQRNPHASYGARDLNEPIV